MKRHEIKKIVREGYAGVAKGKSRSCCGGPDQWEDISKKIGYSEEELKSVPEGSNMGLGCGNPVALASLKEGEIVLDLGAGGGFDCFLAARQVGPHGKVIGVDMTPEMLEKARDNAKKGNYENVEFRLGEIEHLPAADNSVGVVISNCVINLSPDKDSVFRETYRVLKTGGRLMVSDIVLLKELPEVIKEAAGAYVACVSGALLRDEYLEKIREAGFASVEVKDEKHFPLDCLCSDPAVQAVINKVDLPTEELVKAGHLVMSISVEAKKG